MNKPILRYLYRNYNAKVNSMPKNVNLTKDYYKILEISNAACQLTIKRSYLRLAKKFHPDVNPQGHEKFTQLQEAYYVLTDKFTREFYDMNNEYYVYEGKKRNEKS